MRYQYLLVIIIVFINFSKSTTLLTSTSSTETIQSDSHISTSYQPITYEGKEDWLKIQNWELSKENTINNTLYDFLRDEELSDCFIFHRTSTIIKFRCYSKYNIQYTTTLFCIGLTDGFMCI